MQTKNLVVFFVVSLVILFGSQWLFLWLNPPPRRPSPRSTQLETAAPRWPFAKKTQATQDRAVLELTLASLVGGAGLDQPGRLATELWVLSQYAPRPNPWPFANRPRREQLLIISGLALAGGPIREPLGGLAVDAAVLARHVPTAPSPQVEPARPPTTLGDDDTFFLKVEIDARGAAVRKVVLNRFQGADMYGLPVFQDKDKTKAQPLELVPKYRIKDRTEIENPPDHKIIYDESDPLYHYTMYQYPNPEDETQDARPDTALADAFWTLAYQKREADRHEVAFVREIPGHVRITKTFSLAKGDYHVGLSIKLQSLNSENKDKHKFRYQLQGARDLPIEGAWYTNTYRHALIGGGDSKGSAWRHLEDNRMIAHLHGGERIEKRENAIRYAAVAVQFFTALVAVAETDQQPTGRDDFLQWARATREGKANEKMAFLTDITVRLVSEAVPLPPAPNAHEPGPAVEHCYLLYHGPIKVELLGYLTGADQVDPQLVKRYLKQLQLYTLTDYPSPGFFGNVGSWTGMTSLIIMCTNLMHGLLHWLHYLLPIYGLNIIMLTLAVRGLMFPVSRRQAMANQKMQEKMAKLAPEVKKLQDKYPDDPMALNQARNQLYMQHGINPLSAMGGCVLLFVQMPVFLGLYYCLQESIFFRLDALTPWWIPNLAAPDMLIWWTEHIPVVSEPSSLGGTFYLGPYFNLLPMIAVGLMLAHQTMVTPPPTDEQQAMQMKMMKYMTVFFGFMFYKVAAGLCLYFIASSLWGLAERKLLPKSKVPKPGEAGDPPSVSQLRPEGPKPHGNNGTNGLKQRMFDWWHNLLKEANKQQEARREPRETDKKRRRRGDEPTRRRD